MSNTNENQPDGDLFKQFAHLFRLLQRYREQNWRAHGPMGDIYRGQGRILALLKLQPEISQKDLSYLLDMRPQSLGELLAKLEHSGYITRTPAEDDRRVLRIKLTEQGVQAAAQRVELNELFDVLSAEEQATLSGYLERMIAAMEQQFGTQDAEQPGFDQRGAERFGPQGGPRGERGPRGPRGGGRGRRGMGRWDAPPTEGDPRNPAARPWRGPYFA